MSAMTCSGTLLLGVVPHIADRHATFATYLEIDIVRARGARAIICSEGKTSSSALPIRRLLITATRAPCSRSRPASAGMLEIHPFMVERGRAKLGRTESRSRKTMRVLHRRLHEKQQDRPVPPERSDAAIQRLSGAGRHSRRSGPKPRHSSA